MLNALGHQAEAIDLAHLRRQADVFYSRVSILNTAPVYREAVKRAGRQAEVRRILAAMDGVLPVFDGPDAALRTAIGLQVLPVLQPLHTDLRQLSTSVVSATA